MIDTVYRCEICGEETDKPVRWIVIHCSDTQLTVFKWTKEAAEKPMRRFTSAGGFNRSVGKRPGQALALASVGPVDSRTTSSGSTTISAG